MAARQDDDIANIHNVHDMISVFPNMEAEVEELDPQAYDVKEIGHMKFFPVNVSIYGLRSPIILISMCESTRCCGIVTT